MAAAWADLSRFIKCPVIGTGGASNSLNVLEYIMVGTYAVQMVTAPMRRKYPQEMISEVLDFMRKKDCDTLEGLRGLSLRFLPPKDDEGERGII